MTLVHPRTSLHSSRSTIEISLSEFPRRESCWKTIPRPLQGAPLMDGPYFLSDLFQGGPINDPDLIMPSITLRDIDSTTLIHTPRALIQCYMWLSSKALSEQIRDCHVDMWNPPKVPKSQYQMGDTCHVLLYHITFAKSHAYADLISSAQQQKK
jgi:hypothetical protein